MHTPVVLPDRVQHLLRQPPLDEAGFRPTKFTPASTKAWFGRHMRGGHQALLHRGGAAALPLRADPARRPPRR